MAGPPAPLRVTFVLERHLGHQTFADNLRTHVVTDDTVHGTFVDVTYAATTAFWERLPISDQVRGALRGRRQVRTGVQDSDGHVTFFNTQVPAVLGGHVARRGPYVLCTDITPVQYDGMATAYRHEPDTGGPVAAVKHAVNRRVFRQAAHVVAWSSWVRDSLIADYQVGPRHASVIPPGVDVSRWTPRGERHAGPLRILFVGGDLHRKGGGTLLSAFAALPPGTAELTLVTRSPDPGIPGVRVERGLTPNAPALIELYRSSDVFVLPTEAEAFGIAAIEAAAAGLPVIATPVGGLRDIVVEGETGYLISPTDVDALCHHLWRLAADEHLRARLGTAARARALGHFDAGRNARAIVDLLRTVVARSPATALTG
jgi:glycosyltransferase involved in cell wall biosynthesis